MDAAAAVHGCKLHQGMFKGLQQYWFRLTLGTTLPDLQICHASSVCLHHAPLHMLFIPEVLRQLGNVTSLELTCRWTSSVAFAAQPHHNRSFPGPNHIQAIDAWS